MEVDEHFSNEFCYSKRRVIDEIVISRNNGSITANLGQVFLFQVPRLIVILVITFAVSKKFFANLLRNIANLLSQYYYNSIINEF